VAESADDPSADEFVVSAFPPPEQLVTTRTATMTPTAPAHLFEVPISGS
jgi:hypothetical protein